MRKASTLVIFGTLLALAAGSAHALGFGRIGGSTTLGQQLNFSALVRLDPEDALANECVTAEVFSGENKLGAGGVRVNVEPAASANERIVRVTTLTPLDEPVVTITLSVGCSSRLSRKFVVFLDPPFINLAQTNAAEPQAPAQATEPPRSEAQAATPSTQSTAPQQAAARAPSQVARVVKPRPRPKTLTVNPSASAAQGAPAKKSRAGDVEVATRVPSTGARLKLEAPVAAPGMRASESSPISLAAAASAASVAASSASLEEQSQLVAKERERLKALEDSLTRLRTETEATQRTLASLQTRLKGAESDRFSNPLVYALSGLCAALLFAVAAMWRRYSLREAAWWASPQADGAAAVPAREPGSKADVPLLDDDAFEASPVLPLAVPAAAAATQSSTPFSASPDTMPLPSSSAEPPSAAPRRELSVEELIDLEQQAEFFVVLGQDEAAIDLLMGHLRSTGGSSPLPYLKLLEIYRRRGDSEAYNRTRERFNRRFNAYAPDWDSDPQQGRALEDYPEMIERLQTLWSKPTQVIEVLDAALFRRDQSEDTFDVPAYRELVLLYSVVRDLAEHDGGAAVVDLLLPIEGATEQADATLTQPAPFVSTTEVSITELTAASRRPPALDLDISAVRAFERPVDLEMPDLGISSNFLGLVDDAPTKGSPRKR